MTANGQLRLGKNSTGEISIVQNKLDKDNIGKNSLNNINNSIMTEEQLLQAVYLEQIKDRNANNIIECVSYLKYLPIEIIKIALEKASLEQVPEWEYARAILEDWKDKGFKNISDIEENCNPKQSNELKLYVQVNNTEEQGGFKRKGDEILNGE